jgi:hypothetical protein
MLNLGLSTITDNNNTVMPDPHTWISGFLDFPFPWVWVCVVMLNSLHLSNIWRNAKSWSIVDLPDWNPAW